VLSRRGKLHENAAAHFDAGEQLRQSVLVRSGTLRQQNHALVATDRNLYAFRLGWPGFSKVAERLLKVPLGQARVEVTSNRIRVLDGSGREEGVWRRLPFRDPKPLAEYVAERD
jgi:hypothetical protein